MIYLIFDGSYVSVGANLNQFGGVLGVILGISGAYQGQLEGPLEGPFANKIKMSDSS